MNQPSRLPSGVLDGCVIFTPLSLECLGAAIAPEARATITARAIEVFVNMVMSPVFEFATPSWGVRRHYGAPSLLYVKRFTFAKFFEPWPLTAPLACQSVPGQFNIGGIT
jgi:hypothetical protein